MTEYNVRDTFDFSDLVTDTGGNDRGDVQSIEIPAYGMYMRMLNTLAQFDKLADVPAPVDQRERAYLRRLQNIGDDTFNLILHDGEPPVEADRRKARDNFLETLRLWASYLLYQRGSDNLLRVRLTNEDGAADRFRLWVTGAPDQAAVI